MWRNEGPPEHVWRSKAYDKEAGRAFRSGAALVIDAPDVQELGPSFGDMSVCEGITMESGICWSRL